MIHRDPSNDPNTPPVVFRLGQVVPCPRAPDGVGQVAELLRRNVVVLYLRRGRLCRMKISARQLAQQCHHQPLLPGLPDNPFRRAIVRRREKCFA